MNDNELKHEIIQYIKKYYEEEGIPPSVRKILSHFKFSSNKFYQLFPGRAVECYKSAGIQVLDDPAKRTKKATETKKSKEKKNDVTQTVSHRLTLTEKQTEDIRSIAYLEGRKNPHLIIDRLIDMDHKMRTFTGGTVTISGVQWFPSQKQIQITNKNLTLIKGFTLKHNYEGDLSDFINDAIEYFFIAHGIIDRGEDSPRTRETVVDVLF